VLIIRHTQWSIMALFDAYFGRWEKA